MLIKCVANSERVRAALTEDEFTAFMNADLLTDVDRNAVTLAQLRDDRSAYPYFLTEDVVFPVDVSGFPAIRAYPDTVRAVQKLTGHELKNGTNPLQARATQAKRNEALKQHRQKREVELRPGHAVHSVVDRAYANGFTWRERSQPNVAKIYVEDRLIGMFPMEHISVSLNVHLNDGEVLEGLLGRWKLRVAGLLPSLMSDLISAEIAGDPNALINTPKGRAFLATWLKLPTKKKKHLAKRNAIKNVLRSAKVFASLQGDQVSIKDASTKTRVRSARFQGEWLSPAQGEQTTAQDLPILLLPMSDEAAGFTDLVDGIADGPICFDYTKAVLATQGRRRVERGLVVAPTVDAKSEVKRSIKSLALPSQLRLLGAGEIALSRHPGRTVRLFADGVRRKQLIQSGVSPSVEVALESPSLVHEFAKGSLPKRAEEALDAVGYALIRALSGDLEALPQWARNELRRVAMIDMNFNLDGFMEMPLFETTDGRDLSFEDLIAEESGRGELVITTDEKERRTLSDDRPVIRLHPDELLYIEGTFTIIDAQAAFKVEAERAHNMARPARTGFGLSLDGRQPASALLHQVALSGDGVSAPRGRVGLLKPHASLLAGITILRDMKPLGMTQVNGLPVVATVDYAELTPNETFSAPVQDEALGAVRAAVVAAREQMLKSIVTKPPKNALVSLRIDTPDSSGWVWLDPALAGRVTVLDIRGAFELPRETTFRSLAGDLIRSGVGRNTTSFVRDAHRKLAKALADQLAEDKVDDARRDEALAHLLIAARTRIVTESELPGALMIDCFSPTPRSLRDALELLRGRARVAILKDACRVSGVVDDQSQCFQVILNELGSRALGGETVTVETSSPGASGVATRLTRELAALGISHEVTVGRHEALLDFAKNQLTVSLMHQATNIISVDDASPLFGTLLLSAVSTLNRNLDSVTDSHERSALLAVLESWPST